MAGNRGSCCLSAVHLSPCKYRDFYINLIKGLYKQRFCPCSQHGLAAVQPLRALPGARAGAAPHGDDQSARLGEAGEWHRRVKTLGMTAKVWGEWAGVEKDTIATGDVQESGNLAGDIKGCGAQGS
uniref:Uncharacterized protein n=1 Tax=Geospiza parvula TaxID=87175 RepID=A0A8C3M2V2_GEOPR